MSCLMIAACDSKVDRPDPVLSQDQITQRNAQVDQSVIPQGAPAASSVQHYYCANACAGSGGDTAGSCPVCGSEYVHNQAFHNTQVATSQQPIQPGINQTTSSVPEPDQNANGVWHYTCSNGCAGGAGSAIACSQCGNTLAHNAGYHN